LATVNGHVVLAALAGINEFDDHFLADSFEVAVTPVLKRICGSLATALFHGTFISAAASMGLNLIRRSEGDVHVPAISLPPVNACCKMLVGIGDPAVVFFLEFVVFTVRIRITTLPEGLDKLFALFFVRELHKSLALIITDNPAHIFIQPLLVLVIQFSMERLGILFPALLVDWLL